MLQICRVSAHVNREAKQIPQRDGARLAGEGWQSRRLKRDIKPKERRASGCCFTSSSHCNSSVICLCSLNPKAPFPSSGPIQQQGTLPAMPGLCSFSPWQWPVLASAPAVAAPSAPTCSPYSSLKYLLPFLCGSGGGTLVDIMCN